MLTLFITTDNVDMDGEYGNIVIEIFNKYNNIIFNQTIYSIEKIENLKGFINEDEMIDFGETNAGAAEMKFIGNQLSFSVSTGFNHYIPVGRESNFYLNEIELKQFKKEFYKLNQIHYSNQIIKWYKYHKKMKTLWKIAEYYTKKKYSPENILKHIDLDE
jgi:hypothetical protein